MDCSQRVVNHGGFETTYIEVETSYRFFRYIRCVQIVKFHSFQKKAFRSVFE